MRHLKKGRKFGRVRNQRRALMRGLASSFFLSGRIRTTEAKAKELRPLAEKWITHGKTPTLAKRRLLGAVFSDSVVRRIFQIAEQQAGRPGGYTRITKLGPRVRDDARMAIIELVK